MTSDRQLAEHIQRLRTELKRAEQELNRRARAHAQGQPRRGASRGMQVRMAGRGGPVRK